MTGCICGRDDSPTGFRLSIVCPKHDGIFTVEAGELVGVTCDNETPEGPCERWSGHDGECDAWADISKWQGAVPMTDPHSAAAAFNNFAEALAVPIQCHICPERHSTFAFKEAHPEEYERLNHEAFIATRNERIAAELRADTDEEQALAREGAAASIMPTDD